MRTKQTAANTITEGPILKPLLLFFFPILFGTFFQQLYNTTDAVIVGQFVGKEALASVGGPASTIINLLVGFFVGLSSGATVIISQFFGAGKKRDVSKAVHTSIALSLAGGAVMMVIGILIAPLALAWMNTPADIMDSSLLYMRIYFLGMIPSLLYNMGSGILRAVGDSKRPLYFLILSCFINIVLDLLFVVGFRMGVAGVAIATTLSQVCSALMTMGALLRTSQCYRLMLPRICFHPQILSKIIRIGLPAGLQSALYSVSNLLIQSSVNGFGTDTVAAWTTYSKIDGMFWMIMSAFGVATTTFVGQNYGAGKLQRVKKSVRICLSMSAVTSILMGILVISCGHIFIRLFTNDAAVEAICMEVMWIMAPAYITYICIEVLGGALRGCGDAVIPTAITAIGICVLRVVWIFLVVPLRPQLTTVAFSYPLTWVVTSLCFIIYYKRGKWLKFQKSTT